MSSDDRQQQILNVIREYMSTSENPAIIGLYGYILANPDCISGLIAIGAVVLHACPEMDDAVKDMLITMDNEDA